MHVTHTVCVVVHRTETMAEAEGRDSPDFFRRRKAASRTGEVRRPTVEELEILHNSRSEKSLTDLLKSAELDVNIVDTRQWRGAPIHSIVKSSRKDRAEILFAHLMGSTALVDLIDMDGNTALHLVAQCDSDADVECAKILVLFGAKVNSLNVQGKTPLDVAYNAARALYYSEYRRSQELSWMVVSADIPDGQTTTDHPKEQGNINEAAKAQLTAPQHTTDAAASTASCSNKTPSSTTDTHESGSSNLNIVNSASSGATSSSSGTGRTVDIDQLSDSEDELTSLSDVTPVETISPTPWQGFADVDSPPVAKKEVVGVARSPQLLEAGGLNAHGNGNSVRSKRQIVQSAMMQFLESIGCQRAPDFEALSSASPNSLEASIFSSFSRHLKYEYRSPQVREDAYQTNREERQRYMSFEDQINQRMADCASLHAIDEMLVLGKQRKELERYKKTGCRVLCLDGGGVRGLMQIDVLCQIELCTGRRITDLFDWIVGTSTGGIIALALLYAGKSLQELRKLYLKLKDAVFGKQTLGVSYNTDALERLLKEAFGMEIRMSDVKYPKVLITTVNKETTPLQSCIFNNCLENRYSNELVWKVARFTSAGPVLFNESDNFVDGGVLAKNPTLQGMTEIQDFHSRRREKLPISLIVSVGTGVDPPERLGSTKNVTNPLVMKNRMGNVFKLLSNALGDSETVARTCEIQFKQQNIPYLRFNPVLDTPVSVGETDNKKLVEMVMLTRRQTWRNVLELAEIIKP